MRVLPVLADEGCVIGVVDRASLTTGIAAGATTVGELVHAGFERAGEDDVIDDLLTVLSRGHVREAMILDPATKLIGIVTQTDLLAELYRSRVATAVERATEAQ